jgi:hypothetical protein
MLVTLSFIASIFVIWRSISLFLTAMLFFTVEASHFYRRLFGGSKASREDTIEVVGMARSKKSAHGSKAAKAAKAAKRVVAAVASEGEFGDTEDGDASDAMHELCMELKAEINEEDGKTVLKAVVKCVGEQFFHRGSSFKALVRFIDHMTFESDPYVAAAFAGNDDLVEKLVTLLTMWSTKMEAATCPADGKERDMKSIPAELDHSLHDHLIFVWAGLASTTDSLDALLHALDRTSNLVLVFRTMGEMLPREQSYSTQEQSLEVLCRLYAGQKAFLPDYPTDLLSILPEKFVAHCQGKKLSKMLRTMRPTLNAINEHNDNIFSYQLTELLFIVNYSGGEEYEVRLRGFEWLDLGLHEVTMGCPDSWVTFAYSDVRRFHAEDDTDPASAIISLERMPRNLDTALLIASVPPPPPGTYPALRFKFRPQQSTAANQRLLDQLSGIFSARLAALETVNLDPHRRRVSMPASTVRPDQEPQRSPVLRTPAATGVVEDGQISTRLSRDRAKRHVGGDDTELGAQPAKMQKLADTAAAKTAKTPSSAPTGTPVSSRDAVRSSRRGSAPPTTSASSSRTKRTPVRPPTTLPTDSEEEEEEGEAESLMDTEHSGEECEVMDAAPCSNDAEPGENEPANLTVDTETSMDHLDLGAPSPAGSSEDGDGGDMMPMLIAQIVASHAEKASKKKHKRVTVAIDNATATIDGYLEKWVEFNQDTQAETDAELDASLADVSAHADAILKEMDRDAARTRLKVDTIYNTLMRLQPTVASAVAEAQRTDALLRTAQIKCVKDIKRLQARVLADHDRALQVTKQLEASRTQKNQRIMDALKLL